MKSLKNLTGDSLEQLIDYKVVDQNGDEIGSLHSLWSDPSTGAVEFLGVKTGWLFGHNHVVPAEKAELDDAANVVRLPYTETFIKEAPSISADAEISESEEGDIYRYYGFNKGEGIPAGRGAPEATGASTYAGRTATSGVPEAAGAAALASASSCDEGASSSNQPAAGADASANRWRRTRSPGSTHSVIADAVSGGEISAGSAVTSALDDLAPSDSSGARTPTTPAAAGSYGTTNLYGSTGDSTPVSSDTLGEDFTTSEASAPGSSPAAGTVAAAGGSLNADPITGEPGAHPVGTGVGAATAGVAGMAIGGTVGGPIGAPVGAAIGGLVGAVGGGLAGRGIAESVNPTEEDAYWKANYQHASYAESGQEYGDFAPAYRVGYEGYGRYAGEGKDYAEVEPDLERDYTQARGTSPLGWEKAKAATYDAWNRLKAKASEASK